MTRPTFGEGQNFDDWTRNIDEMIEEMHKRTFFEFRGSGTWQPSTNVYEISAAYLICLDLAGIEENQVEVQCIDARHVLVTGCRHKPRPEGVAGPLSIHVMEIDEGPFRREYDLPQPVDTARIEATYRKGYLWIMLPKATS